MSNRKSVFVSIVVGFLIFLITAIIGFVVTAIVSFLYSLIVHKTGVVDWGISIRLAIIIAVMTVILNDINNKKRKKR